MYRVTDTSIKGLMVIELDFPLLKLNYVRQEHNVSFKKNLTTSILLLNIDY
jgi:hypothetical protein